MLSQPLERYYYLAIKDYFFQKDFFPLLLDSDPAMQCWDRPLNLNPKSVT